MRNVPVVVVARCVRDGGPGALEGGWVVTASAPSGRRSRWFADSQCIGDSEQEARAFAAREEYSIKAEVAWSALSPDERDIWRRRFNAAIGDRIPNVAEFYLESLAVSHA